MSFQRFFGSMLLTATLAAGSLVSGCAHVAAGEPDDLGEQAQALESNDNDVMIISMNGLPPGILMDAGYQAAMASLATGPMSASTPLADTRDGRALLSYLAVCALQEGAEVVTTASDGSQYRMSGHLGLAAGWKLGAVSGSEKRWISACLLAHANAYGLNVEIDLHGEHPALAGAVAPGFEAQEAAFYGDLFQTGTAFACVGSSPSEADGMPKRVCGRTDLCRFEITGSCEPGNADSVCGGGPTTYRACETEDPEVVVDEVITVYAKPGTFGTDGLCPHPVSEEGYPLAESCSSTTAAVCGTDPYCCDVAWDSACVALAGVPHNGF